MKHPQVVVCERDGQLAELLRPLTTERRWALHQPRQLEVCLRQLRGGDLTVLVLKLSSKLEQDLALLERVHWQMPHARAVVVGDVENDALAELAWDLGAGFVLFPPLPREWLPEVVASLMSAVVAGQQPPGTAAGKKGSGVETTGDQGPSR